MKKIIMLTAILGFTSISLANNDLDKINTINLTLEKESETPCADAWIQNVKSFQTIGFSTAESYERADNLFNACLEATYGPSIN